MKTAAQREEAFRLELYALLKKHGAELTVADDRKPWGLHSGVCEISMSCVRDDDGNIVADYTEFFL